MKRLIVSVLAFISILSCSDSNDPNPGALNIPADKGHEYLSQYGFFEDVANLIPNSEVGVLPYDLNVPLFSDYALKKRFIYVPEGSEIPFDELQTLNLPVGSVLIKNFYYNQNGIDNIIETRLLIRRTEGWQAELYIWEEDQTDAKRSVVGGTRELEIQVDGTSQIFNYLIPNQNQCKNCHGNNGVIEPIGPNIPNLNKEFDYEEGTSNQLEKWNQEGILELPNDVSSISKWPKMTEEGALLNDRARAYLASNCSSCHRRHGSAANSGLYLEYNNTDSLSSGYWKTPVAAGDGSGGLDYVIKPGSAEESILYYRMNSRDVDVRMPEIGRDLIHTEGVQLIKEWIDNM